MLQELSQLITCSYQQVWFTEINHTLLSYIGNQYFITARKTDRQTDRQRNILKESQTERDINLFQYIVKMQP